MKYTITKKFTDSVRLTDGTLKSFTTGLEVEVDADSADKLIAENDKLFAQAKWLVERDEAKTFGTGE
jgi:hypothetical protein